MNPVQARHIICVETHSGRLLRVRYSDFYSINLQQRFLTDYLQQAVKEYLQSHKEQDITEAWEKTAKIVKLYSDERIERWIAEMDNLLVFVRIHFILHLKNPQVTFQCRGTVRSILSSCHDAGCANVPSSATRPTRSNCSHLATNILATV